MRAASTGGKDRLAPQKYHPTPLDSPALVFVSALFRAILPQKAAASRPSVSLPPNVSRSDSKPSREQRTLNFICFPPCLFVGCWQVDFLLFGPAFFFTVTFTVSSCKCFFHPALVVNLFWELEWLVANYFGCSRALIIKYCVR
ncbi:hypothetical protein AVEN_199431-1 [Araneus ventricosus]|uniref:Uncharacterized protein n=1 Tax=Araneus ventricosus TaxID=182803 RepID=A0A4Y2UAK5_ARAVE|nr:hypothetical protein AVEN_199431-1 [Araneus ventricosus]